MTITARSQNLDLYRKLHGGHNFTAMRLKSVTNPAYLSDMANGVREISDVLAREIEAALKLPSGWLDQENTALLYLSTADYALHRAIQSLPTDVRMALHDLTRSIAANRVAPS